MKYSLNLQNLPTFDVHPLTDLWNKKLKHTLDQKTKPIGSLGKLESIAIQMGRIQNTVSPEIKSPKLLIFAADHGIATEGVSAYPQEVTYQMVLNFMSGGAAANVLAKLHGVEIQIIDSGVNHDFGVTENLRNEKMGFGTKSFLLGEAMTAEQVTACFERGSEISLELYKSGTNFLAFGEMGIGNTSSSSLLTHLLTGVALEFCTGSGTGLDHKGIEKKLSILNASLDRFNLLYSDPMVPDLMDIFKNFGGYEILMMAGAMLSAASLGMTLLVDGFISTVAFLCAYMMKPAIKDYAIFSHISGEKGHIYLLNYLEVDPLLNLGLRLGEGSGALLAFPIISSSIKILQEMASFESANVSTKNEN